MSATDPEYVPRHAVLAEQRHALFEHIASVGTLAWTLGDRRLAKLTAALMNTMKADERDQSDTERRDGAP